MFANERGLHKWDTTQLLVVDGLDKSVFRWAEKSLVHEFHLILQVWQCVHIVCRMINGLLGQQLQVLLGHDICCGFWWSWINWESPKMIDGVSAASQYKLFVKINSAFLNIKYHFTTCIAEFSCRY